MDILRSMLYVPAFNERFINKSLESKADALIYDLEDSVPQEFKKDARALLKKRIGEGLVKNKKAFIRLNSIDSYMLIEDLMSVCHADVYGFLLSKTSSKEDIMFIDKLLSQLEALNGLEINHFKLAALIETAEGIMNVQEIAHSSDRLTALLLGGEDFISDIGGGKCHGNKAMDFARIQLVLAAKSAGICAIDTPFLKVHDSEGFIDNEMLSAELGMDGIQVLSPVQIENAHKCFTPSDEEVKKSKQIIEACRESEKRGSGVVMLGNEMVGPPLKKRAEKIVEKMTLIDQV